MISFCISNIYSIPPRSRCLYHIVNLLLRDKMLHSLLCERRPHVLILQNLKKRIHCGKMNFLSLKSSEKKSTSFINAHDHKSYFCHCILVIGWMIDTCITGGRRRNCKTISRVQQHTFKNTLCCIKPHRASLLELVTLYHHTAAEPDHILVLKLHLAGRRLNI